MNSATPLRVCVVYAPQARQVQELSLTLPAGATVGQALAQTGWWPTRAGPLPAGAEPADGAAPPALQALPDDLSVGLWGRRCSLSTPLRDGDRVELCRPLQVDPKVARRERFQRQGARSAGLFSQRRPGAKSGY